DLLVGGGDGGGRLGHSLLGSGQLILGHLGGGGQISHRLLGGGELTGRLGGELTRLGCGDGQVFVVLCLGRGIAHLGGRFRKGLPAAVVPARPLAGPAAPIGAGPSGPETGGRANSGQASDPRLAAAVPSQRLTTRSRPQDTSRPSRP